LLFSLPCHIELGDIASTLTEVIRKGTLLEAQVLGKRSYQMRAQPYRNLSGECKGAVLTFHDITDMLSHVQEKATSLERLQHAERFSQATINALTKLIGVMDDQGILVSANKHWIKAEADGNRCTLGCKEGGNVLLSCVRRAAQGDAAAAEMLQGLQRVMRGETALHEQQFPIHLTDEGAVFKVVARPFENLEAGAYWVIACEDITHQIRSQKKLALQARALNASWSAITIVDARLPDMPVVYVNDAFTTMTGYESEEILGKNCRMLQGRDRMQPGLNAIRESLATGKPARALLRNYRKDGTMFWNELTLSPIVEKGVVTHVVGMQRDMTASLAADSALKASLERESQALEFAGLGSFEVGIRRGLISLSSRHARLIGLPLGEQSLPLTEFQNMLLAEDRPSFVDSLRVCVAGHAVFDLEYRMRRTDGGLLWLHSRGNAVLNEHGVASRLLGLSQDITARKNSEESMRFIAHHDALTRLPNRALLRDRFQLAINGARRSHTRVALMFIDLDLFKDINDTLGHEVGDQLLISVADRMQQCVRDTDTICRQSGDEFIALLPGVHDHNDAARLAEKLIQSIAKPHFIRGHKLHVTCSAGISIFPDDGDTIDDLMRHADSAMYHAKGGGRNAVEFFSKNMNVRQQERLSINTALRGAVDRQELVLHYQPQFSISTGALIGIEALVRWQHPQRGLVMPAQFIDIAEESDLISEIGDWVLREACQQARRWQDAGLPKVPMAVNVSPVQMRQRRIIESVTTALHDSGLDPKYLEIELTERAIIHNLDEVRNLMADFRRDGVRLVLDDFGTGYSSLSALHRFPVDKLKIDRSFIADSVTDPGAAAIVRAVIHLASGMSLDIVAEGVESEAQLSFLRKEGCGAFQGFLAAQGCPADRLEEILSAEQPWRTAAQPVQ
jgi:diguanylate cyclase (GGDEF)-like protein/PAS domain S-box-containing protein